jgi:hypothetical protein
MPKKGEFTKLLVASFVSQSGSHFLTIALSAFVFASSGSVTKAALVFVLSYLPSIFFSAQLGDWIDRKLSKWLLARNELISIVTSVLCGACIAFKLPLLVLAATVAARFLLLFIARTGGSKWIKLISPAELQSTRIKLFFLSFFLSTAVAGVLAGIVLSHPSVVTVIAIDVATYLLSFTVILSLRQLPEHLRNPDTATPITRGLIATIVEIQRIPGVGAHFVAVCLSQALFQGAYSVLVSYLPIAKLHMGLQGIGAFQFAASIGITIGFLVVWAWPNFLARESKASLVRFSAILGIGVGSLILSATARGELASLIPFCLFNVAYECVWLFNSAEFFRKSPSSSLARYQFTLTSTASLVMAISTVGYSLMIEHLGEVGFIAIVGLTLVSWRLLSRRGGFARGSLMVGGGQ